MRRPSVSCLPLVSPIESQNNRKHVKTSNQIKWMRSVWLRISVSVEYRLHSDITPPCPCHTIPDMAQAKSLCHDSERDEGRETPLGYWLTLSLFTWLSRPSILMFALPVTLFTFSFVLSTVTIFRLLWFGFCSTHTYHSAI